MKGGAKKIVQIMLLLVLIAGGGVAYLWQSGEDLASIGDKMTAMLLGEEPAPAKPAVAAAPVSAPAPNPIPPIPDQPVKGQIQNSAFTVQTAEIQNGVLLLRQGGTEPPIVEVRVDLRTQPWEVPAGRNFQFVNPNAARQTPLVR